MHVVTTKLKDPVPISLKIERDLHTELKELANADDRPLRYILYKALIEYVENHKDNLNQ